MTDAQRAHGEQKPAAFPGLQLLGDDTAIGACVDGVCGVPGTTSSDEVPEKAD